jgi:hypothetical protein
MHLRPTRSFRWFALLLIVAATLILAACGVSRSGQPAISASSGQVNAQAIAGAQREAGARFQSLRLAYDKAGTLHLTYGVQSDKGAGLFHQQRAADGAWSPPELLRQGDGTADLLASPPGEVGVLWTG